MTDKQIEQFQEMLERQVRIETIVTEMDHKLFGNGQPGVLKLLDDRVKDLEGWKKWVVGLAAGGGLYGLAKIAEFFK